MLNDTELAPHIEDLRRALGEEISAEKIKEELNKYFEYGIEIAEAKKAVVKKLGGDLKQLSIGIVRTLAEILPTDNNIDLKVKILSINEKMVAVQGSEKKIYYGLLADKSIVRPFTAWNDFNLSKNDVIDVRSAYAKDWRGEAQVNFGNKTTIEPLEDRELDGLSGSDLPSSLPSTEYKINTLRDGLSNVTVIGRILSIEQRTVTVMDVNKEIYTGIIADDTAKIAFTAWNDFKLKPGEVIKISGGYIRTWRGLPKLNFDERMEVERLGDDVLPSIDELGTEQVSRIEGILEVGGGMDVTVEGTVLEIKDGSGLIQRCPECKRVLRNSECMVHGTQEGRSDLRVKAVIDDGSGTLIGVLNANLTSKLLGKSAEECMHDAEDMGPDHITSILNGIDEKLLLKPIRLKGTVTVDEYGAMMICTDLDQIPISEDVTAKAKELLDNFNLNLDAIDREQEV